MDYERFVEVKSFMAVCYELEERFWKRNPKWFRQMKYQRLLKEGIMDDKS